LDQSLVRRLNGKRRIRKPAPANRTSHANDTKTTPKPDFWANGISTMSKTALGKTNTLD
jgi:hypothetical protein